jgi:hypothetical protein
MFSIIEFLMRNQIEKEYFIAKRKFIDVL